MSAEQLGPQHVGLMKNPSIHPTIQIMADRLGAASERGSRVDGHTVALAIEGGGIAGAVSAGMCVALQAAGLINTVDRIYGTSSGALNGSFTAAGQGALGATNYEDILDPAFLSLRRPFRRKSIVNFDYLFKDVMGRKDPFDFERFLNGPQFSALAVNLELQKAEVLKNFKDTDDLMLGLRASCAMPVYSGRPILYRGSQMTDGALLSSVPFRAAQEDGASHVLALRSRGEEYRKDNYHPAELAVVKYAGSRVLASLVAGRPKIYNEDAEELQYGNSPTVTQIAPSEETPVKQLEKSLPKIRRGFHLGVSAVGQAFGMPPLEVHWQNLPVIVAKFVH